MAHHPPQLPAGPAGYFEALARAVLQSGISWRVVEAKWNGIREALSGFDPVQVAAMTPADVDRLLSDQRMIRNRAKVEALVYNARELLELDRQHGGFDHYLASLGEYESVAPELRKRFRFLGETTVYFFLWGAGYPVPAHEEWTSSRGGSRGSRR